MSQNPLQQYFRRPAVYLKLPSGGVGYPSTAIDLPDNGEIPIYPMTAIDEITARTPDSLFNGTAVVDIVRSCAPNIKDPWLISNIDLDPILVAIKAATNGNEMDINSTCPECDEDSKYGINLAGVLASFKPGDYSTPLNLNDDVQVKFKALNFKRVNQANIEQFQLQKVMQNLLNVEDDLERQEEGKKLLLEVNNIATGLIADSIEYIKIPSATVMEPSFILEFLKNCDSVTYDRIKNHSIKLKESTESKPLNMKCVNCNHEYQQAFSINVSDFFG